MESTIKRSTNIDINVFGNNGESLKSGVIDVQNINDSDLRLMVELTEKHKFILSLPYNKLKCFSEMLNEFLKLVEDEKTSIDNK